VFDFLSKKLSSLFDGLRDATIQQSTLDTVMNQVGDALLESDVPYAVVTAFKDELKKQLANAPRDKRLKPVEQIMKVVYDTMVGFMGGAKQYSMKVEYPDSIMVVGLQGSGKTTTVGKLAHLYTQEAEKRGKKRSILCASVDFYRPAAIDQLEIVTKQVGVQFYRAQATEPIAATREIISYAKQKGAQLLLLDTAGRMHVDTEMIQEVKEIAAIAKPRHTLLVLDAMTGQQSLAVAQAFDAAVGFEAAILTKMDSDTRGGAAFAFRYALKKPIAYVATGEKMDALAPFHADRAVSRMLGQGDLQTLAEQADVVIRQDEQEKAVKAMASGAFTLVDFADQMDMVSRLGSFSNIAKMMPGMGSSVSEAQLEQGERELKRFRAIINSMTPKERIIPAILDNSRMNRVAKGAGVSKQEVGILLERFKQAQQYAKLLKKSGFFKGLFK
jgi:signal recognition particle subunit SRP54